MARKFNASNYSVLLKHATYFKLDQKWQHIIFCLNTSGPKRFCFFTIVIALSPLFHHHKHHQYGHHHRHDNSLVCRRVWQLRSGQTKLLHSCPSYTAQHHINPKKNQNTKPGEKTGQSYQQSHQTPVTMSLSSWSWWRNWFFGISQKLDFQQRDKVCQG